jgi:hypothetical protein
LSPGDNLISISDIISFLGPVRHFATSEGNPMYDTRWELVPGNGIDLLDLLAVIAGPAEHPPMLGGARAFGGPACPWQQ